VKLALLEDEVDVNYSSWDGRTSVSFAVERGDVVMTQLLKAENIEVYLNNREITSPLGWASRMGRVKLVNLLKEVDIARRDQHFRDYGNSLLCLVAKDGQENIVELYLAAGVDPSARDSCYRIVLSLVSGSHSRTMKLLIAAGARVNHADAHGRTLLIYEVREGYR
ncbi:ankyrin repeat-containing domain protein, partial [Bipolaris maydis]|uniref:ankyrin repeat-containing domain protein n=1 Tax=Cochliobolus heterostrophus TaxID=5016 RepID=UPI0024D3DA24